MSLHPLAAATAVLAGVGFLAGSFGLAQQNPSIKYAPPEQVPASDGSGMYRAYCAVCHGVDARGGGPAAPALKKAPVDLTQLSRTHGGKFPINLVANAISGSDVVASHGSRDMPIWGNVFQTLGGGDPIVKLRTANLAGYLESLQRK